MKIFLIISLIVSYLTNFSQTSGYVLQNADSTIKIPDSSISTAKIKGFNQAVSGNLKTINNIAIWGSGNIDVAGGATSWGSISGTLSNQSDLQTVLNGKQNTISLGTNLQYFRGDLSLATFPTTTAFLSNSANKNFVTDAQAVVIGATSGTNTGDNATNTQYQNDFRAGNFIAGTNYLAPNGNGSSLTGLTKAQVGLANADNTSDANKPVSTATQTALNNKSTYYVGLDAGANDSYVITASPAPVSYTVGMIVIFRANTQNTTGCTINVNGLGVVNIVKRVSTTPATGDILAQMFCMLVYNGTAFVILNPVVN